MGPAKGAKNLPHTWWGHSPFIVSHWGPSLSLTGDPHYLSLGTLIVSHWWPSLSLTGDPHCLSVTGDPHCLSLGTLTVSHWGPSLSLTGDPHCLSLGTLTVSHWGPSLPLTGDPHCLSLDILHVSVMLFITRSSRDREAYVFRKSKAYIGGGWMTWTVRIVDRGVVSTLDSLKILLLGVWGEMASSHRLYNPDMHALGAASQKPFGVGDSRRSQLIEPNPSNVNERVVPYCGGVLGIWSKILTNSEIQAEKHINLTPKISNPFLRPCNFYSKEGVTLAT